MAAKSMEEIADYMKTMRFHKKIFGGVDETDVWRQLEKLQTEYRSAFEAQQEQSRALIREREAIISRLKTQLAAAAHSGRDSNV